MNRKLALSFAAFAGLALASAKSYTVSLFFPVKVGATELKAGDYRLELDNNKVVIRSGRKIQSEADVRVEENSTKYNTTTVRVTGAAGNQHIQEIRLGGTKTKLVFND